MLTCLNQHRAAMAEWLKQWLKRLRIAATSMLEYVTGWYGHGSPFVAIFADVPQG